MTNPEFDTKSELAENQLERLAILYAQVFGAPPWNEVWRCPSCDRFYGPEYQVKTLSSCCGFPLTVAYPVEETMKYIRGELAKPQAKLEMGFSPEGELIAFTWGFSIINIADLAEKKWPQSETTQKQVVESVAKLYNCDLPLFYLSEIGISPSYRGQGLSTQMSQSLSSYGLSLRQAVILRTNWASPIMRVAQKLEMTQIMGPKVKTTPGLIEKTDQIAGFIDQVNPDRTLFIKLPEIVL